MCGRLTQTLSVSHYRNELGMPYKDMFEGIVEEPIGDFNVLPGIGHLTLRIIDDKVVTEKIKLQYLSEYARQQGFAPAINAQIEKLLTPYYRVMMKTGRIIVPVDGWYEWVKEGKVKQPWYIKRKDGKPMYLAALTNHFPDQEDSEGAGFVVITNASAGGMVDVHDRRPVVLSPDDARDWMDLSFDYKQAESIARERSLPVEAFEWYKVSRDVNGYKFHGPNLIDRLFPDDDRDDPLLF